MKLKPLSIRNLKQIIEIHISAFPDFFLTTLGKRFLETYYKASLESSESVAIGAFNDYGDLLGFCIGCVHSRGYHKRLVLKNIFKFLCQGLIITITRPVAMIRLIENFDKKKKTDDYGDYGELLSIGVSTENKGNGIGKELIIEFEKEMVRRQCTKIALTTDYYNNDAVVTFYEKNGYKVFYDFVTYPNRKMYKLIKKIEN